MDHPMKFDGVIYQSSRSGGTSRCLALFSRPDAPTVENLLLHRQDYGVQPITKDLDVLQHLIAHDIDLR
jgi:hypothetical protein